ncbi:MAG: hypothetical protein ACOX1S_12520 [Anaerostipes sp.]|jgi:uncharacterized protein (TIGR02646 family)
MIYIEKKSEPTSLRLQRETPGADFDSLDKRSLRKSLLEEQGYLCAYCMKRIREDKSVKIEHYHARNSENQMDYENLLAVCTGNQTLRDDKGKVQRDRFTCDSCKGEKELHINPQSKYDMKTIKYTNSGFIQSSREDFQNDIDYILNLNDVHGHLIRNREHALKPIISRLHKLRKGQDAMPILRKLEKYCNEKDECGKLPEYAGIMRWYVAKQIRKHS